MQKYFKSLDGIRGMMICVVITYHYLIMYRYNPSVLGFSWIFIQMFFVQSGYLITSILLRSKDQTFAVYSREFYWRRVLRIFPVYFLYIGFFVVSNVLLHNIQGLSERLPYLVTFTYNYTRLFPDMDYRYIWFTHFWSLSVEEQFYLLWPVIIYFLSKKQLQSLIGILVLAIPFFRYWFADYLVNSGYSADMTGKILYAFTFSQFDAFAIGAAIPLFDLQTKIIKPGRWVLIALAIVLAVGLINYTSIKSAVPEFSITSLGYSLARLDNLQHVWSYTLVNVLFMLVVLYLIHPHYKGIFNFPLFVSMGKVVYGMYVFHLVILFVIVWFNNKYIHNQGISLLIAIVLTYVVSWLSYHLYEKKFLMLKDWWVSRDQSKKQINS